jgi:hypothetical protein
MSGTESTFNPLLDEDCGDVSSEVAAIAVGKVKASSGEASAVVRTAWTHAWMILALGMVDPYFCEKRSGL